VLRSDWEDLKRLEQEKDAEDAALLFENNDSSVVINFEALCDDIYICDWA
jgi:hypothetical protein